MERAFPGQKLIAPSGHHVALVTQPIADQRDMLSFRIEDAHGVTEFTSSERWSDRHRLHFVWDSSDQLWVYSSDVGTDVFERAPGGTWSARPWVQTELTPPKELAPYLKR